MCTCTYAINRSIIQLIKYILPFNLPIHDHSCQAGQDRVYRFALSGQTVDILVVDGNLSKISLLLMHRLIGSFPIRGLHVSIGWFDLFAHFGDPGLEHKETLETGASAAAAGGFIGCFVGAQYPTGPVFQISDRVYGQ